MDKKNLTEFLLKARTKTYAGNQGKVEPKLDGSYQLEFCEGDWLYRDVYYMGNNIFTGLETIYYQSQPVWSMSYFGDYKLLTEEETDRVLRGALIYKWQTTRLWEHVEWETVNYKYVCDGSGDIDELEGSEIITRDNEQVYFFYYAGGYIGKKQI